MFYDWKIVEYTYIVDIFIYFLLLNNPAKKLDRSHHKFPV